MIASFLMTETAATVNKLVPTCHSGLPEGIWNLKKNILKMAYYTYNLVKCLFVMENNLQASNCLDQMEQFKKEKTFPMFGSEFSV